MNLLRGIGPGKLEGFAWQNEPERWEPLPEGGLRIYAPAGSNDFLDPAGDRVEDSAPFLGMSVKGDFVARLLVRPQFRSTYDSGCLMVRESSGRWAKICYESTDFGSQAVISVVTSGVSDDANGADLVVPQAWLQLARVGERFALHYRLSDEPWRMVRYFRLPAAEEVQVGMLAQCPVGPGTIVDWLAFTLEQRRLATPRAGV